jgi:hypothetical protein
MLEDIAITVLSQDPMFYASAVASLIGLTLWYLYRGFIVENYQRLKWLRRILFPHLSILLRVADDKTEVDLGKLYVTTKIHDYEFVDEVQLPKDTIEEEANETVKDYLMSQSFRPELILSSIAEHPKGYPEVGNFVLTAPEKNHPSVPAYGIFYELFHMLISKYQLHVRYYYNEDDNSYEFYAHKELNPYNPLYAKGHFNSEDFDAEEGVQLTQENYMGDIQELFE